MQWDIFVTWTLYVQTDQKFTLKVFPQASLLVLICQLFHKNVFEVVLQNKMSCTPGQTKKRLIKRLKIGTNILLHV